MRCVLSIEASGHLLALAATVLWSGTYVVARGMADSMSPVELSLWRWGLAFLTLLPFTAKSLCRHARAIRRHLPLLFLISVIGFSAFTTFIFVAGRSTEAINMSLLATASPVFMAFFSRFFLKERLTSRQTAGLCVALVGVLVLICRGDIHRLLSLSFSLGDLWMLFASMMFAAYSIVVRYRPRELPQLTFLSASVGLCVLSLLPFALWQMVFGPPPVLPSLAGFSGFLYMGVIASVVCFYFWNVSIVAIGAVRAGVVYYSLPLFSSVLAMLFLGEHMHPAQMLGGVLIIGGILFSSLDVLRHHESRV